MTILNLREQIRLCSLSTASISRIRQKVFSEVLQTATLRISSKDGENAESVINQTFLSLIDTLTKKASLLKTVPNASKDLLTEVSARIGCAKQNSTPMLSYEELTALCQSYEFSANKVEDFLGWCETRSWRGQATLKDLEAIYNLAVAE